MLVVGSGIAGLLHVALARAMGAGFIMAADTIPVRLETARKIGADVTLKADENLANPSEM